MARTAVAERGSKKKAMPSEIDTSDHTAADQSRECTAEIGTLLASKLQVRTPAKFAVFMIGEDGEQQYFASHDVVVRNSFQTIVFEELGAASSCLDGGMQSTKAPTTTPVFDPLTMNHSPNRAIKRRQSRPTPLAGVTSQRRSMMSRRARMKAMPMAIRETTDGVDAANVSDEPSEGDDDLPKPEKSSFVNVSNEADVIDFMFNRLTKIQHLSNKVMAKNWIRRICPKKQAIYPYTKGQLKQQPAPWWPPVEQCKYAEPDHINKEDRERLLVHLLRLRPTPEQLDEWNQEDENDPRRGREVHVHEGWTAFLRGAFTIEDLANKNESPKRIEQRWQYVDDLFTIAEMEENWLRYGQANRYALLGDDECIDEDAPKLKVSQLDPPKKRSAKKSSATKSSRRSAVARTGVASGRVPAEDVAELSTMEESKSSEAAYDSAVELKHPVTPITASVQDLPQNPEDRTIQDVNPHNSWRSDAINDCHYQRLPAGWQTPITPASPSFTEANVSTRSVPDCDPARFRSEQWRSATRPGEAYGGFQTPMYQDLQVYAAQYIAEPQFSTVQSTPFLPSPEETHASFTSVPEQNLAPNDSTGLNHQSTMVHSSMLPWDTMHQPAHGTLVPPYAWHPTELPYHFQQHMART